MFHKGHKIEDLILEILSNGSVDTKTLIEKIKLVRLNTSKQAVYKILKVLKENEIIIQNREEIAISSVWLKKLVDFVEKSRLSYKTENNLDINFVNLKQGEKVSYSFKNFEIADMFWAHVFDILLDITPFSFPIFIYNPHEWPLLARTQSETYLLNRLQNISKKLFLLVGNRTQLDIDVGKYFDGEVTNYFASNETVFPKSNYYVNVFDDFLIEVWLDPKISADLDLFYKENKVLDENSKNKILEIIKQKGRNKLVITRNKRKADTIRRVFSKFFVIK